VPLSFAGRLLQRLGVELARDHELPA
jgi:hypothetical protein